MAHSTWHIEFRSRPTIAAFFVIYFVASVFWLDNVSAQIEKQPWYETLPAVAMDYKVHLPAGKEDCYYQYVQPGATLYVSFQVRVQQKTPAITCSFLFVSSDSVGWVRFGADFVHNSFLFCAQKKFHRTKNMLDQVITTVLLPSQRFLRSLKVFRIVFFLFFFNLKQKNKGDSRWWW